ncbi:MAG: hypothetical protein P4L10_06410 [Acidobacteriaceae bacterium]|nr:hypothetical protein [Acidobacteriaceae bacterium]
MSKPADSFSDVPAASQRRLIISLALIAFIGLLAWFTMDASAVLHVKGLSGRYVAVPVRCIPIVFLALFAFRICMANMRAKLEKK